MGTKIKYPAFTKADVAFIRRNHMKMTNQEFADRFGMPYRSFCARKCDLGIRNMEMEYWTPVQIKYLLKWYQRRGDLELARMFSKKWYKRKGWTLKHIEKKRLYLKLKRTPEELHRIKERAKRQGIYIRASKKTWATRGVKKEGTIVYWKRHNEGHARPFVKVKGRFILWSRWYWQKHYGKIPEGMKVAFIDGNPYNRKLSNLELIDLHEQGVRAGYAIRNLTDNYIIGLLAHGSPEIKEMIKQDPHLIEMKRKTLTLNRKLYELQQKAS